MPIRIVACLSGAVLAMTHLMGAPATAQEDSLEERVHRAFNLLGLENLEGGLTTDPARIAEGLPLLEAAAAEGDGLSQNALGMAYANALFGLELDLEKALALYEDAMDSDNAGTVAKLNWAMVQYAVGDPALAVPRLEEVYASDEDIAPAVAATLAEAHALGKGTERDLLRAGELYEEAIAFNPNDSQSHYMLGRGYEAGFFEGSTAARGLSHYLRAAELGDPRAAWKIGMAHLQAAPGFDGGSHEAYTWVRRSAEGGWTEGMISTAVMLATGDGVEKNTEEAASWYEQAATRGSAHAMRGLGAMHAFGELEDSDPDLGLALIELGLEGGDEMAQSLLDAVDTRGIVRDEVERFKEEWRERVASAP